MSLLDKKTKQKTQLQQTAFAYDHSCMTLADQRQVIGYLIVVTSLQNVLTDIFCPIFKGFTHQICEVMTCKKDAKTGNAVLPSTLLTLSLKVLKKQMDDDESSV